MTHPSGAAHSASGGFVTGTEVRLQGRVKECSNLIESGIRLLDVGCSSGWLAPLVMSRGVRDYVGIDRAIVRDRPARSGATFVEGTVFGLPFRDQTFDAVCLFDVIEHLPKGSEGRALLEIHRVLRSKGRLYFSTPHASPVHTPLDPAWLLGHRHYRRATVRRLLDAAGFRVDRMFVAGGVVECLDYIRFLSYKHLLRRSAPSLEFVNRLVEQSHGRDQRLGMNIFAVSSRPH